MTVAQALIAYVLAAGLLTITPGLDTAMVLRTAAVRGSRRAAAAALGICLGLSLWGVASAVGLTALVAASETAYIALKWLGAAYLVWLGAGMLLRPHGMLGEPQSSGTTRGAAPFFRQGLFTNLLNPKIGVFYITFLPQFVPAGVDAPAFIFGLVAIHIAMGVLWFAALILAVRPMDAVLRRPSVGRWLSRITGAVFVGFGARLALSRT
jgi:threonine/homoserine/homoserine lactone efflux protein